MTTMTTAEIDLPTAPVGPGAPGFTTFEVLKRWGWTAAREDAFQQSHVKSGLVPGRVVSEGKGAALAETASGPVTVVIQRGFRRAALSPEDFPHVGDWLALEPLGDGDAAVREVLPRSTAFVRHGAGREPEAQVVAANVDTCLLVSALTRDLNPRRIERYLALAFASGARPVIILNKADLCTDLPGAITEVEAIAPGVPIVALSAQTGEGMEGLAPYLEPGQTIVLLGSSGVGKSTITNALLGDARQVIREVREDDHRGRHTTTSREIFVLPEGALLIDTPGMRSIGMWDSNGLQAAFGDIDALAEGCRFSDCTHRSEPGCNVKAAVRAGSLTEERLEGQRKLEREIQSIERRRSSANSREESRRFARMVKTVTRTRARMRGEEPW